MMRKEIKKSYIIFNIVLAFTLVFLLLNVLIIKNTSMWFNAFVPAVVFLIFFFTYGYEKKSKRFTYESMFYVFAYTVLFILATYIIGIFSGFYRSIYSLSFSNLIKNIIPYLSIIAFSELLRDEVIRKCEGSWISYLLVTIIMVLIDCILFLTTFNLGDGDGQIKFLCNILLPSVSKNFLLLYVTRIGGIIPSLIYRILMEMKLFILPFFPDFGLYIECVVLTVFPVVLGFAIFLSLRQYKNKEVEGKTIKQSKLYTYSSIIITLIAVAVIVSLTSCNFKYGAIAIGSGSMTGTINKGDAIIYKRLDNQVINMGDVVVFRKENKLIVHRIIDIVGIGQDEFVYYTKGDANVTPDGYPLRRSDIVGKVTTRIKYIGIPSVELSELLKKKK